MGFVQHPDGAGLHNKLVCKRICIPSSTSAVPLVPRRPFAVEICLDHAWLSQRLLGLVPFQPHSNVQDIWPLPAMTLSIQASTMTSSSELR